MARYLGGRCRLCRRVGDKLLLKGSRCYSAKCAFEKRSAPPGQHTFRRRRISDRGLQLREKQKVRYSYGMLERQFRRFFAEAKKAPGITGENLLILLERRLDNVVYRLGFADSRAQARQLVRHGHIDLNKRRTDIPSCLVKPGDVIEWRQRSTKTEYYKNLTQEIGSREIPIWLSLDMQNIVGKVLTLPTRSDVDTKFDEKAIVEYYSR